MRAHQILKAGALSLLPLLGAACAGNKADTQQPAPDNAAAAEIFPLPQLPASVTEPGERASMAAARFWDGAVLAAGVDTVTPALEQAFANFAAIAQMAAERDSIGHGAATLLRKGGVDLIMPLAERYLYDPNSPLRSEELFIVFLEQAPQWARTEGLLDHAIKNRQGTPAADFPFIDAHGRRGSLAEFVNARGETFVYFFDSECDVCKALIPRAAEMAGGLPVLAVCPEANAAKFNEVTALFPEDWTVVRDLGLIDTEDLYFFPALPAVYIIGADGTVMQKDPAIR